MERASKAGRKPRKADPGQRVSLGLRIPPKVKNQLDAAAKLSGRTQSTEAAMRIVMSFQHEKVFDEVIERLFGCVNGDLLTAVFGTLLKAAAEVSRDQSRFEHWLDDHATRKAVAHFLRLLAAKFDGSEEPKRPSSSVAELLLRDICIREMTNEWLAQRRERQGDRAEWMEEFVRDLQRWATEHKVVTTHHVMAIESEGER